MAILAGKLAKPLATARKTGLPLYCGELGGYLSAAPRTSRMAWYRDMVTVLTEHDVAWATWNYKGSFGLRKRDAKVDEDLVGILVPESPTSGTAGGLREGEPPEAGYLLP